MQYWCILDRLCTQPPCQSSQFQENRGLYCFAVDIAPILRVRLIVPIWRALCIWLYGAAFFATALGAIAFPNSCVCSVLLEHGCTKKVRKPCKRPCLCRSLRCLMSAEAVAQNDISLSMSATTNVISAIHRAVRNTHGLCNATCNSESTMRMIRHPKAKDDMQTILHRRKCPTCLAK